MSVDGGKNRRCGMDVCERVGTDSVVSGRNGPLKSSKPPETAKVSHTAAGDVEGGLHVSPLTQSEGYGEHEEGCEIKDGFNWRFARL
ncbi:hypothetical protein F441_06618 [Phytophthora nicotianae CJ01A1]|uniref:Uncharacterized protein n=3 Tax=Phytophthora nicotianae TaxID=4792 RepID=W2RCK2_PHYN3|nr:hypothetical protein PPTG_20964 [Phytophthora nicotianae INRA-310]ETK89480.1 hypothetical protein L915_06483 [Phytophthora nicotianae]ETP19359.1 hypothetical protein F441_06618 [Phytophthora nicotianae CJ01A1]ETL42885.1 hypothetical protein L916_06426 [Phytophthora nicotianae]ETL96056.1 hypothetical protein L917_06293 [Phytophthora nicotianae]ETM49237.1 hypothetical protein L914_06399 [Phytophthora nicotianae]